MKLSAGAWVRLPLALLRERGLTKAAAAVCCVLLDRATSAELSAWFPVSAADLVADTGYTRRTVQRSIDDLVALGLIERESNKGNGCTNRYRLKAECIELCGRAADPKKQRPQKAHRRSTNELDESAYLAFVNNFKEDD